MGAAPLERLAVLEAQTATLMAGLNKHMDDCTQARKDTNERFIRLERVMWMASGALGLLMLGINVVKAIHGS